MKKEESVRFTQSLPKWLYDKVKEASGKQGISMSDLIKQLVLDWAEAEGKRIPEIVSNFEKRLDEMRDFLLARIEEIANKVEKK